MNKYNRHINVFDYDFDNDSLLFRDESFKYHSSIDMGDLILDIGEDGSPIGMELLNASKNFGVRKISLRGIKDIKASINVSDEVIEVKISVYVEKRNNTVEKVSISHGVNDLNLQAGETAMAC